MQQDALVQGINVPDPPGTANHRNTADLVPDSPPFCEAFCCNGSHQRRALIPKMRMREVPGRARKGQVKTSGCT